MSPITDKTCAWFWLSFQHMARPKAPKPLCVGRWCEGGRVWVANGYWVYSYGKWGAKVPSTSMDYWFWIIVCSIPCIYMLWKFYPNLMPEWFLQNNVSQQNQPVTSRVFQCHITLPQTSQASEEGQAARSPIHSPSGCHFRHPNITYKSPEVEVDSMIIYCCRNNEALFGWYSSYSTQQKSTTLY